MTKKEPSGYRGAALQALESAGVEVGDIVRVRKGDRVFEGTLLPRSEYGGEDCLVVKLRNGYNVGVRMTPDTEIKRTGRGIKPSFESPGLPSQKSGLPKVALISTGGTIASRVDYRTGAVRPALTASDLYSVVPELAEIAQVNAQILTTLFSENITPSHWTEIAQATARQIKSGVDGVVIAHGTDTMGYTAAAMSFCLQNLPVPVVLVGSQRSADRPSSDAATNLIAATACAARAPFAEVVVAMHETVSDTAVAFHRGTRVRKCHTSRRDAFRSVNARPLARTSGHDIEVLTCEYRKRQPGAQLMLKTDFEEKVALSKFYPGIDAAIFDLYVEKGYRGIVLEGTGLGHVGKYLFTALRNVIEHGVVVVMCSQCIWGRVNMNVYESGRDLLALGVIPLADMLPETALVKLMWTLGQTRDVAEAGGIMRMNLAGEMSARTGVEKVGFE